MDREASRGSDPTAFTVSDFDLSTHRSFASAIGRRSHSAHGSDRAESVDTVS
jgi:hypothetical protein